MNLHWLATVAIVANSYVTHAHKEFTPEGCLAIHNKLRALHKDTNDVMYDAELEKSAKDSAQFLSFSDSSEVDLRPTRVLPKRRRRHVNDDVDERRHVESWDGEVYYPESTIPKKYGESIHKMCCTTAPHCPRVFFHGLLFPPSAEGVVNDFYQEEINSYDFASGKKKTQFYTQIKHFTNIVWKATTKIGCAQTAITSKNCVYTIIHYEVKGSEGSPDVFKQNVGDLVVESTGSKVLTIFLVVFFIVLLISLIVLCVCCRDRIREKYFEIKIKTDTMKAEQELETDSTAFWWLRIFKRRRPTQRRQSQSRSTKHRSLRGADISIEVVHNTRPQRSFKQPPRVRGQSNAQSFVIKYQGISQKPKAYDPDESIYENTRCFSKPKPADEEIYENSPGYSKKITPPPEDHKPLGREPSFSGKPPPPPVPIPQSRPAPSPLIPPQRQQLTQQLESKPKPILRPTESQRSTPPVAAIKPVLKQPKVDSPKTAPLKPVMKPPAPPSTAPRPSTRPIPAVRKVENESDEDSASRSVNELRNKFNQQQYDNSGKKTPPVKAKPMLPPTYRR